MTETGAEGAGDTVSGNVCVGGTRTSTLFDRHRAVGERQGLVHISSGLEDPPELPLCVGPIGPGRVGESVPWLASSRLHGWAFSQAPCRTSASAGSHAPGPRQGAEPRCVSIFPLAQVHVQPCRRASRSPWCGSHSQERETSFPPDSP